MQAYERQAQIFPTFSSLQVEAALRFASAGQRQFQPGQKLYDVGERHVPAWLILQGSVEVFRHSGLGIRTTFATYCPGQLTGETNQLSGGATLAGAVAGINGAVAIPFDAAHLRALVIGSADVGEIVMRSFILRRVALIEAGHEGGAGSVLVGRRDDAGIIELSGFLTRNGYPYAVIPTCENEGHEIIERLGVKNTELPLMVCPNGTILRRPTLEAAASCLGILPDLDQDKVYDVAVIGAGPAGLATAVYAASEGLSALVVDSRAYGGQAGASARIENYLGFPTGISGQALAGRAFSQAAKFGADLAIPLTVSAIRCAAGGVPGVFDLGLDNGTVARARAVVMASGVRYRRPNIPDVDSLEGVGISYWASPIEARLCAGEEIAVVGGGNSAGQAVAFLAPHVKKLHLLSRRPLNHSMSQYLIARIGALPNVEIHLGAEIAHLNGDRSTGLTGATFVYRDSGTVEDYAIRHLFLFIGADPNTQWLNDSILVDPKGFVLTGSDAGPGSRSSLSTSRHGIFAVGDVRSGSTKRVAAAVGEGAAVVAQLHSFLSHL